MAEFDPNPCPHCAGVQFIVTELPDGSRTSRRCICAITARNGKMLSLARIPKRYQHCTFESFDTKFASGENRSLSKALVTAQRFVEAYPLETDGKGLLLTGSIGVGKTHLAVSILQSLIQRGAQGLFFDYRDLLKQIQNSYNSSVNETELSVLEPIFNAEVLVLDEVGASKPTEWVMDTVAHILNTRYNDNRTTILTTNYANLPPLGMQGGDNSRAYREDTLGDRIGERMRSRLQEMCVVMEMHGEDFRQRVKRATFA